METSRNVFVEDLHTTRNMQKTYYVTDNKQSTTEFFWIRESGLQIHVGFQDVHLIPEYEDVAHESDNRYVLHNAQHNVHSTEDQAKFRNILRNYCRFIQLIPTPTLKQVANIYLNILKSL